jgi:hypothetical protein
VTISDKLQREAIAADLEMIGDHPDPRLRIYRHPCGHEYAHPTYGVRHGKFPRCACNPETGVFPEIDVADSAEAHLMVLSPDYKVAQAGWFKVAALLAVGKHIEPRPASTAWRTRYGLGWMTSNQVHACREIDRLGVTLDEVASSYFTSPRSMLAYATSRDLVKYPTWLIQTPYRAYANVPKRYLSHPQP